MNDLANVWIEKYRPNTLNDLCVGDGVRKKLESFKDEIPNLLFCGNVGVGKTSLAKILVHDVLKCDYLYINASDENGIDTIRNKITGFIQTKSFDGNIKVVVLDEADAMTKNAQDALRNMMESYAANARFILTGNHKHKISAALQSRCQSLDIRPTLKQAFKRCIDILANEGVEIDQEQKKQVLILVKNNFPDLRSCISELQKFTIDNELNIAQKGNNSELCARIYSDIESGNTLSLRKYLIQNDELFDSDWDQLLVDLLNYIYDSELHDDKKKETIIKIADHLEKASRVNDKEINFFACVLSLED